DATRRHAMEGLMMDYPLSLPTILRRARTFFPGKSVISRRPDKSVHRSNYGECIDRAARLAAALRRPGLKPGDRVATLAWNHWRHLEVYYAVPAAGFVLHTLNLRLHPDDLVFIANDAEDKVVIVDKSLWPLWEKCAERTKVRHTIVVTDD